MMTKWKINRSELLDMGAGFVVERGYTTEGVAGSFVRDYFLGTGRRQALRRFETALEKKVAAAKRAQWEARLAEERRLQNELEAEGWKWYGHLGEGFYRHPEGYEVNRMGGLWPSKATAARKTYYSYARVSLLSRLGRAEKARQLEAKLKRRARGLS